MNKMWLNQISVLSEHFSTKWTNVSTAVLFISYLCCLTVRSCTNVAESHIGSVIFMNTRLKKARNIAVTVSSTWMPFVCLITASCIYPLRLQHLFQIQLSIHGPVSWINSLSSYTRICLRLQHLETLQCISAWKLNTQTYCVIFAFVCLRIWLWSVVSIEVTQHLRKWSVAAFRNTIMHLGKGTLSWFQNPPANSSGHWGYST